VGRKYRSLCVEVDERGRRRWTAAEAGELGGGGGGVTAAALDTNRYDSAVNVTDERLHRLQLTRNAVHGAWNYMLTPRKRNGPACL
jgi:hypothetical protein